MINKTLVKDRFRKNLKTYRKHSIIQTKMAEELIRMIDYKPESVLELGCGSGVLTEKLFNNNIKNYYAVDIVTECENYIKEISPNIKFISADIENYNFKEKYDLIISNATFQWIESLPEFIDRLKQNLNDNGKIIFSTFGQENFKEIKKITGFGLKYYSKDEIKSLIKPKIIEEDILTLEFENPKEVLKHLKYTGVNSLTTNHWTKSNLINFEKKYLEMSPNIELTYHPIYVSI